MARSCNSLIRQVFLAVILPHNAEVVGSSPTLATNRPTLTAVQAVRFRLREQQTPDSHVAQSYLLRRSKERSQPNLMPVRQRVRILQLATLALWHCSEYCAGLGFCASSPRTRAGMSRICFPIALLGVAAVLSGCARSGNPETVTQPVANATTAAAPTAADPGVAAEPGAPATAAAGQAVPGARVFIDPVTGAVRKPTRAEAAAGAAAERVQREAVGGQAGSEGTQRERFVLPDGTEGVKLAPRDKRAVLVCLQADGSYSENCPPAVGGSNP